MSVTYSSAVIFGVKIPHKKLFRTEQVPNCKHEFDSPFCPTCGKPRFSEKHHSVFEDLLEEGEINGISYFEYNINDYEYDLYVGYVLAKCIYGEQEFSPHISDKQKNLLIQFLKDKEFYFDEKALGYHLVASCS